MDVAALLVRIGGEATGYLAMLSGAQSETSRTFGVMRGVARGAASELTDVLGLKLPAAAQTMSRGLDMMGQSLQSLGKNVSLTSSISKLSGGQLAVAAEGAARLGIAIGTLIRPWVNANLGLGESMGLVARQHDDLVDALEDDDERFHVALQLYDKMRGSLGLLGDEWRITAERTRENAARLVTMTNALMQHTRELKETKRYVNPLSRDMLELGNAIRGYQNLLKTGGESVDDFITRLKEMHNITAAQDPIKALEALQEEFKLLAASGEASSAQLVASFAPRVAELEQELAKLGVSLPDAMDEWVSALSGPGSGMTVMDSYIKQIREQLPDAAAIAGEALKQTATDLGGMLRGARGELTELGAELDNFAKKREVILEIVPNWERYDRELSQRGLEPNTGGRVP